MKRELPRHAGNFLASYAQDARRRWTREDRAEQQAFVHHRLCGRRWADWSTETAALALLQPGLVPAALAQGHEPDVVLLAGPLVELIDPLELFRAAADHLAPGGVLVGIVPCLRDNSPESDLFARLTAEAFWPYFVAEELLELLREAGFTPNPDCKFVPIPQFQHAALRRELAFPGFGEVLGRLQAEGYDAHEVGWGELRLAASLDPSAE